MSKGSTFPFDADAFFTGTVEMTNEQVGIYIRLLSLQWSRKGLPSDENALSRFCSCDRNAIASVLHKFPVCDDGQRRNPRLETDRAARESRSASQAANAYQRWGRKPTSEESKRIADIFRRRHSTEWSEKEVLAFRAVKESIVLADLEIVASYYESERALGREGIFRRELLTFLNNYLGELDRARQWESTMKRKSANLSGPQTGYPEGFAAWFATEHPTRRIAELSGGTRESLVAEFRRVK